MNEQTLGFPDACVRDLSHAPPVRERLAARPVDRELDRELDRARRQRARVRARVRARPAANTMALWQRQPRRRRFNGARTLQSTPEMRIFRSRR